MLHLSIFPCSQQVSHVQVRRLTVSLPKILAASLSFLKSAWYRAWFSNIWILRDWIWDWTRTNSCMCFMAFTVCLFTFCPLTTPWSLTRPFRALKLLLACIALQILFFTRLIFLSYYWKAIKMIGSRRIMRANDDSILTRSVSQGKLAQYISLLRHIIFKFDKKEMANFVFARK